MSTDGSLSRRKAWFVLLVVLVMSISWGLAQTSRSADDKGKDAAAAKADAKGEAAKPEAPKEQNFFLWIAEVSGLIGVVIFGLSVYFVATVSRLFYDLRLQVAVPPEMLAQVEDLLAQRNFKDVFNVVKEDDSIFSRLLSTGIAELPNGLAEARDVMERQGEAIAVDLEKRISILAVLGTLGPMIGLLGTLKGMIGSFSVIARSDTALKASAVAGGISEALVLTFEGVALSVPSIYFFSLFHNRVSVITTTAMMEADQFLRHFAHAARTKAAGPGAATGVAATKTVTKA